MGEKILIAGGSGFIGSHVTKNLLAQGYSVSYLSRNPDKVDRIKAYYWDPGAGQFDDQALKDVSYLINLSGAGIADKRWSPERKKIILKSRTQSTAFLRDQLKKGNHTVKTLISPSGVGYYGYDNGDRWQKETSRFGDDFLATVTKAWEGEAKMYEEIGIRVVILRIGVLLSDDGGALPKMIQPIKLGAGAPLGSGNQWMSWIHIDDLTGIMLLALNEEHIRGVYNAVAPNPVTNKTFTKEAAKALNKPLFLPNIPGFALKIVLGEMSSLLLGSGRVSSESIVAAGYKFKYQTVDQALIDLLGKK